MHPCAPTGLSLAPPETRSTCPLVTHASIACTRARSAPYSGAAPGLELHRKTSRRTKTGLGAWQQTRISQHDLRLSCRRDHTAHKRKERGPICCRGNRRTPGGRFHRITGQSKWSRRTGALRTATGESAQTPRLRPVCQPDAQLDFSTAESFGRKSRRRSCCRTSRCQWHWECALPCENLCRNHKHHRRNPPTFVARHESSSCGAVARTGRGHGNRKRLGTRTPVAYRMVPVGWSRIIRNRGAGRIERVGSSGTKPCIWVHAKSLPAGPFRST